MKHYLQIEIDTGRANKPLPDDTTDAIAQRAYMFLYSRGCEAGVKATLMEPVKRDHGQEDE